MSTVTPNFNWPVPTSTDLVKDGATAIEALGDSIDASLVDLKGGTTGQVLSKASNTDMDFVWVTDAAGDITGVTATSPLTGGGTSGTVTVGIQSASTSQLGAVQLSDSTSSTSTTLAATANAVKSAYDPAFTNNYYAGKNKIINGDFNIWQRGTSISAGTGTVYNSDRFFTGRDGSGATVTVSRQQFTAGTAPVSGYESLYYLRFNQTVAGSGGTYSVLGQRIEGATTLANQTATVSFWAKSDAARSITLNFNRNYGTGGSGDDYNLITAPSFNLTTSWQRFTASFTIPTVSGKTIASNGYLEMNFFLAGNTVQINEFWGVQLEAGSTATPFQTATGTLAGELAACQRYYQKSYPQGVTPGTNNVANGLCASTVGSNTIPNDDRYSTTYFKQTMRTSPTMTIRPYGTASNTSRVSDGNGSDLAAGSGTITALTSDSTFNVYNASGGSITTVFKVVLYHYEASAEL